EVMDRVRDVCSAASSVRKARGLHTRLPLLELTVASHDAERLRPFVNLIREELNVRRVELTTDVGSLAQRLLKVNAPVVGPRVGPAMQAVMAAARHGRWRQLDDGGVEVAGHALGPGDFDLRLVPADESTSRALPANDGVVVLDVTVTPEQRAEGLARDVVRIVQTARRDAGLHVADRIHLVLDLPDDVAAAVESHRAYVMEQTLALGLVLAGPISDARRYELPDGRAVHVGSSRVSRD
ncbi:MAG TPA: DUF5915 domain-containing protein, partial [Acidimicrobiales bacterium]|nr:DUF5915 domain-containing protein [Acidimicrobiales bacterium]